MRPLHVERLGGKGPTLVLVHGAVAPGWATFEAQRPLADRYRLVVPHRPGYPPNPRGEGIGFDEQADAIAELVERAGRGAHLVGHSYGGVLSLLVAARLGRELASLTVIEPPAFGIARGDPAVEQMLGELADAFAGPADARAFLTGFLATAGSNFVPPDPLPPALEASVHAFRTEPDPATAVIPFEAIRATGVPVLVVSGGHSAAYDAVCDVVVRELGAQRAVLTGANHSVQRLGPPFNERLVAFLGAAEGLPRS